MIFLSFEQKLINLHSVYWLTDWLTDWLKNLLWPKSYKVSGSKSPDQHSLEAATTLIMSTWMPVCALKSKTIIFSTVNTVRTWWESATRWEKAWVLSSFVIVLFFILKCNSNLYFFIHPYSHTFNWHLQVKIMQKEIQDRCLYSKLFPDSGLVNY